MDSNKDIEMATKPLAGTDNANSPKDNSEDRPPTPPKRDYIAELVAAETESKRRTTRFFPRPKVIYKPKNTENWMSCLKNLLVIFNLLIWLFGAVLTGIGVWIKVDQDFWEIQTGLDMTQFAAASNIIIAAGVVIMLVGFVGCYGALSHSLCMLILYATVIVVIILLEIAVMALVWSAINNKDVKEEIKSKAKKAIQEMAQNEHQQHFLNILQSKLKCCGIDGSDDYTEGIPHSCTDPDTGSAFKKGCLETVIEYMKSKAGLLGGIAVGVLVLQVAALILTLCVACGLKNAASNAIF